MLDKQGRDAPPIPVMPEVAVHRDDGLRRPAREAARPAAAAASVRTALEASLPARVAHLFTPPPRFSGSRNPLHPAYLPLHSAPVIIERVPSGPRSPSETSPGGLPFAVSPNPAGFRPCGGITAWNGRDGPSPRQRAMGDACDSGRNQHEVIHVQP